MGPRAFAVPAIGEGVTAKKELVFFFCQPESEELVYFYRDFQHTGGTRRKKKIWLLGGGLVRSWKGVLYELRFQLLKKNFCAKDQDVPLKRTIGGAHSFASYGAFFQSLLTDFQSYLVQVHSDREVGFLFGKDLRGKSWSPSC